MAEDGWFDAELVLGKVLKLLAFGPKEREVIKAANLRGLQRIKETDERNQRMEQELHHLRKDMNDLVQAVQALHEGGEAVAEAS